MLIGAFRTGPFTEGEPNWAISPAPGRVVLQLAEVIKVSVAAGVPGTGSGLDARYDDEQENGEHCSCNSLNYGIFHELQCVTSIP